MKKKLIVYIDNVGRTLIGNVSTEINTDPGKIDIKNPAVINIIPDNTGKLQVQVLPLFFNELLSTETRDNGTTWTYNINTITVANNIEITDQLKEQYNRIFNPSPIIVPEDNNKTVKLF